MAIKTILKAVFRCETKSPASSNPECGIVTLLITNNEKNDQFFQENPEGLVSLQLLKAEAYEQFEPGQEYQLAIQVV